VLHRLAEVVDNGAGRPPDLRGPAADNAGATLGVFGLETLPLVFVLAAVFVGPPLQ